MDLDNDVQWDDSDDYAIFDASIYATSYNKSGDVLEYILSAPEHKPPSVTFSYDVAFTKGATDNELFFNIMELDTCKFDNYEIFSTSTAAEHFGPNYISATTHHLISSSSYIAAILPAAYTVDFFFRNWINGLSGLNRPVNAKKMRNPSPIQTGQYFDEDPGGYEPTWWLQSTSPNEAI